MSLKSIVLHTIIIPSVLLLMACGLSGFDKKPINGDLDGQWQVMEVEPLSIDQLHLLGDMTSSDSSCPSPNPAEFSEHIIQGF